jgi:hypothetical protein
MLDIECALVVNFHWSLYDIDLTEVESVLGFMNHLPKWKSDGPEKAMPRAYAEDLDL